MHRDADNPHGAAYRHNRRLLAAAAAALIALSACSSDEPQTPDPTTPTPSQSRTSPHGSPAPSWTPAPAASEVSTDPADYEEILQAARKAVETASGSVTWSGVEASPVDGVCGHRFVDTGEIEGGLAKVDTEAVVPELSKALEPHGFVDVEEGVTAGGEWWIDLDRDDSSRMAVRLKGDVRLALLIPTGGDDCAEISQSRD